MQDSGDFLDFPRLHDGEESTTESSELGIPATEVAMDATAKLTGFDIKYESGGDSANAIWSTPIIHQDSFQARLSIHAGPNDSRAPLTLTQQLVGALGKLTNDVLQMRTALEHRESELAAGIPVVASKDDAAQLQSRLQAVLRGLCDGLDCQAAALYLLDDSTTVLKLRAQWGLPHLRYVNPARPLRGSVADLEALTGHAVVIEETALLPHWKVPEEEFASAVCVPICSPSTILGTLWVFCNRVRDFSPEETNLIEIIAGRVSGELERIVLIEEAKEIKHLRLFEEEMAHWQQERNLLVPPLLEGWEIAGARFEAASLHSDFFHWRMLNENQIGIATAGVTGESGSSFLSATALQSSLQTQLLNDGCPQRVVEALNEFAWANSPGDHCASIFYGMLDIKRAEMKFATAGTSDAYVLRPHGWEPLAVESLMLGIDPDNRYETEQVSIAAGDVIFAVSERHWSGKHVDTISIAEYLLCHTHRRSREIADLAIDKLTQDVSSDRSPGVIVVKRHE